MKRSGKDWLSISLWTSGIYYKHDLKWYYFETKYKLAQWSFFCFEFDLSTGNSTVWQDGKITHSKHINDLKNLTRKPESLKDHLVMGKIEQEQLVGYKCEDVVIKFGNLQVYNDYPTQDITCTSNGNYLGKAFNIY